MPTTDPKAAEGESRIKARASVEGVVETSQNKAQHPDPSHFLDERCHPVSSEIEIACAASRGHRTGRRRDPPERHRGQHPSVSHEQPYGKGKGNINKASRHDGAGQADSTYEYVSASQSPRRRRLCCSEIKNEIVLPGSLGSWRRIPALIRGKVMPRGTDCEVSGERKASHLYAYGCRRSQQRDHQENEK